MNVPKVNSETLVWLFKMVEMVDTLKAKGVLEWLRKLQETTNEALQAASREGIGGPVNWKDLSCVNAQWVVDMDGNTWARVEIKKADPSASGLQKFVQGYLAEHGFSNVEVQTEW